MTSLIGNVVDGRYRLVKPLGEGGMGSVYAAEHTRIRRTVAIKLLNTSNELKEERLVRFFREAQTASEIGHPNIIEIFDVGVEEDGTAFIVMELLEGQALGDLLREKGTLSPDASVSIILQILSALEAAHAKGVVHRDLKPDNVFLAMDSKGREEVKLLDFGVSKVQQASGAIQRVDLTQEGVVLGTPLYLSPEQARGQTDVDQRIDIWAVGVMFYEMLSNCMPFDGNNYNEVLTKILTESPLPLGELVPDLPEALLAVVEKAMAPWRDDRHGSAAEMIEELLAFQSDVPMTSASRLALQSSIPPPPNGELEEPSSLRDTARSATKDEPVSNTLAALADTEIQGESRQRAAPKRRRSAWLLGGAGAIVGVAALLHLLSGSPESQQAQPLTSPQPSSPTDESVLPATSESATSSIEAAAADSAAPEVAEVTIKLLDVPAGAAVTVDGQPEVSPITVPQSNEEVLLEVTADGYMLYRETVVPDENRTVQVTMRRIPRTPSRRPPAQATPPASTSQPGSGWADNPFKE